MIGTHDSTNGTTAGTNDLVNRVQQLRLNDQLGAAKKGGGGSWLPWVLCAMLAVTWAGVGVRWYRAAGTKDEGSGTAAPTSGPSRPSSGGDAPPAVPPGEIVFQLKGNLTPSLQVAVSPDDVGARVTEITFWEGKSVNEGDILAKLVNSQYENRHKTEEAAVASAKARVKEAETAIAAAQAGLKKADADIQNSAAQIELAKAELKRAPTGSQSDVDKAKASLVASNSQLEVAKASRETAQTQLDAAEAKLVATKAEVTAAEFRRIEAQRLLDNCIIKAPISGTILSKRADKGALVNPLAFASTSGSLCEIANLGTMEAEVDVPERQITKVRANLDCILAPDANPSRIYRGFIHRIMPVADDSKNIIKVRVRVILPKGEKPGSFLVPKMSVGVSAYNRDFVPNPQTDQEWK